MYKDNNKDNKDNNKDNKDYLKVLYNTYSQCSDQGKINLLKNVSEEEAIFIFEYCYNYSKIIDDYLKKHVNAITYDLCMKHGREFSDSLINKIMNKASDRVIYYCLLLGKGEFSDFLELSNKELLMLINSSASPAIRARAALSYTSDLRSSVDLLRDRNDQAALCSMEHYFEIDCFSVFELFELLFCGYLDPNSTLCYQIFERLTARDIIGAIENIGKFGPIVNYNKKIMKKLLDFPEVVDNLTETSAIKFFEVLGIAAVPYELLNKLPHACFSDKLLDISINGTDKELNDFFLCLMMYNSEANFKMRLCDAVKLRYSTLTKYKNEVIKAVYKTSFKDAEYIEEAMGLNTSDIICKLRNGEYLSDEEYLRLELKD